MSTVPLFREDDRLDQMLIALKRIETKLDALCALAANDTQALRAMIAGEPVVVENEDEAVPALATCPQCDKVAETPEQVEKRFGYRLMGDGVRRVQSWCRCCRSIK